MHCKLVVSNEIANPLLFIILLYAFALASLLLEASDRQLTAALLLWLLVALEELGRELGSQTGRRTAGMREAASYRREPVMIGEAAGWNWL